MGQWSIPKTTFSVLVISTLLSAPSGTYPRQRIRDSLAGGSSLNWDLITTNRNDRTLVTFQLTNDVTSNTFTVNFESASTSFTCVYNTAVPTGKPVEMFFSPDELYTETFLVSSIKVENSRYVYLIVYMHFNTAKK